MKYIYYDAKHVKEAWSQKAHAAQTEASTKLDEKSTQAFILSKSMIWTELKPVLESLSDGKCWYSEAKDKVSHWQVDHFRPKKLYPWLAFDWKNFRLCGGKPNRKKTDEFPLEDESCRARADASDTSGENPLLLDPVCWSDPQLLTFKADGEPTCADPADELAVRRVRETVSALALDSSILCDARREKWRHCETKLKTLRDIVEVNRQRKNVDAAAFSRELCRDIADLFADQAEFTATAKACAAQLGAHELVALARAVFQRTRQEAT
jgi:uncharacterized protein (TIGR02646 family)